MLTVSRRNWLIVLLFSILFTLLYSITQAAPTAALTLVNVTAPDINCVFDLDCTITVADTVDYFTPPFASGSGFLQSRTFPVGEAGTAAAGLYGYLYRVNLSEAAGLTAISCVTSLSLDFGPIVPLDYDGKMGPTDIFVVTGGGLGEVAPSSAEQLGDTVTFYFSTPVCAGDAPGDGESSFFFGLTSANPPADTLAQLQGTLGLDETLKARAPQAAEVALPCGGIYAPIADSYVNQADPSMNYGAFEVLRTGRASGNYQDSIFQFDLGDIPSTATIYSATLELSLIQWEGKEPYKIIVNNLKNPWDEATVSWSSHPSLLTNYGTFTVDPAAAHPLTLDVTTMVAEWVDGTYDNHGVGVGVPRTTADEYNLYWASREENDPVSARPRLIVKCAVETASDSSLNLMANASYGRTGQEIILTGTGYNPGGYVGSVLWDGMPLQTLEIPSGGNFTQSFTIPAEASNGAHTITVCAGAPCFTGEFEQSASVPFEVAQYNVYLPILQVPGHSTPPELVIKIDNSVQPAPINLPELGGEERPLAAIADPFGNVATFVANELVVQSDNQALIDRILADYEGEILLEIDPSEADIDGLPMMYLIRVNVATAALASLTDDLKALDGGSEAKAAGEHLISSEDGARLLAIASAEAVDGNSIGVNWIGTSDSIPTTALEAAGGVTVGGVSYNRNAYNWTFMQSGGVQDIGTADAWNALYYGGKYGNRVKIAILDGGFAPNDDFAAGVTYISVIPGIFDPRNVRDVEGNWHGTNVFQTAMATADNNFGIVGVAHTVGEPILLYTTYDYVISIASVIAARAAGAKVINMSYSADVPAIVSWTVLPFEATTAAVRASGTLLFASAGNSNQNVDDQSCFIVCWENTLHTPCENAGVICVGGLEWNSQNRAISGSGSGSNFGSGGGVHIFAPYRVYAGRDPDNMSGGSTAGLISGTSFSSPYTAGVAALIWAANPSLSADQVWAVMRDTAHTSPDATVPRYVDAYEAVLRATNLAVTADIASPVSGRSYDKNRSITLRADVGYVANSAGIPVTVQWTSSRDGVLGSQTYNPGRGAHGFSYEIYRSNLSTGTHTIRVRVTAGSMVAEDTVSITIVNTPPTASIDSPPNNTTICFGESVTFRGSAFDINQLSGLPNSAFRWNSSINGNLGTGADITRNNLAAGTHTITLTATDDGGLTDTDTITFMVLAASHPDCADLAPAVQITSPANGYSVYADQSDPDGWYKQITFNGMVSDNEDSISDLTVEWFSDVEGPLTPVSVNNSTGFTTVTDRLHAECFSTTHTITLRVTDSAGNISEDQILVHVSVLC